MINHDYFSILPTLVSKVKAFRSYRSKIVVTLLLYYRCSIEHGVVGVWVANCPM